MPGVPNETAETAITKDGDGDEEEDGAERERDRAREGDGQSLASSFSFRFLHLLPKLQIGRDRGNNLCQPADFVTPICSTLEEF